MSYQQPYPQYPQPYPQYPQPYPQYPQPGYGYVPLPRLAHWGQRVGAYLIDSVIAGIPVVPGVVFALTTAEVVGYDRYGTPVTEPTAAGLLVMLLGYAAAIGFQIWNRWVRQGRTGQSLGKQALGIRLLSERTMAPVGGGMAFVRDLAHVVDGPLYLGYLWPIWDTKRQTFADKIVSTLVAVD